MKSKRMRPLRPWLRSLSLWGLVCLAVGTATGCSSFGRAWRQAGELPTPADSPAGRWEGRWVSEATGHHGRLRAVLTPEAPDIYRTHFRARYAGFLTFGYTVRLHTTRENGTFQFQGEADLGKFAGGRYTYRGYATRTNLFSTYRSQRDHGRFELRRP